MTHCYRHLTAEDRAAIMMMRATHSIRAIASHLGRAPSSVSRELARHTVDSIKGYPEFDTSSPILACNRYLRSENLK